MTKEFRNLKYYNSVCDWYSISNYGDFVSHRKRVRGGSRNEYIIDPNYIKERSTRFSYKESKKTKERKISAVRTRVVYPREFIWVDPRSEKNTYVTSNSDGSTIKKDFQLHQLIMWAFRPLDEEPHAPIGFPQEEWDLITPSGKRFLSTYMTIDHKDGDPTNNYVDLYDRSKDNLEWVVPSENTQRATLHYGGNVANATNNFLVDLQLPKQNITTLEDFFV